MADKKVEVRDVVYQQVAADLLGRLEEGDKILRFKEGLRFDQDDEVLMVRVIKKKAEPDTKDAVGEYFVGENGALTYKTYKAKE